MGWEESGAGEGDPNSSLSGLRTAQGASLGLSLLICEVGGTESLSSRDDGTRRHTNPRPDIVNKLKGLAASKVQPWSYREESRAARG